MSLTFGFLTVKDLYEKLLKDAKAIEDSVTKEKVFNFVVTAYHIRDWIKNDPTLNVAATDFNANYRSNIYFQACRDLTNSIKHFTLNYNPATKNTQKKEGFSSGRFGKGSFGIGEESISIELSNGDIIDILNFKNEIIIFWQVFLRKYGII